MPSFAAQPERFEPEGTRGVSSNRLEEQFAARVEADPDLAARLAPYEVQWSPFSYQRCDNCVYYLSYQQWCDHPDFQIAVGAEWWCNLWRI